MEDSSMWRIFEFRFSIADFRLSIADWRFATSPHWGGPRGCYLESETGVYRRDVKNEGTSGDVYENKGKHGKMSVKKHAICTKMHESRAI
jgi:hypothetical protein